MKLFITEKEATQQLGVSSSAIRLLVNSGKIQAFYDRDTMMLKQEEIDSFKDSKEYKQLLEEGCVFVEKKDSYGNITLVLFFLCAFVFLISVFARRLYLLEFVVPVLALAGIIFLGLNLINHYKNKEKRRLAEETAAETERILNQIERLQNQSENNK